MRTRARAGFSLVELMIVVGILAVLAAFALPSFRSSNAMRVDEATRLVRDAMETARLRSVAVNRPLQVRFNCPATGQFRVVEAGWPDAGRCSTTSYPYPAPTDAAYRTPPQPRFDGPLRMVDRRVTLSGSDPSLALQFNPDGRAYRVVSGSAQVISSVAVTVTSDGYTKSVTVNSLGKVRTQ